MRGLENRLQNKMMRDKTIVVVVDTQEPENEPMVFNTDSIPKARKIIAENFDLTQAETRDVFNFSKRNLGKRL